MDNQYQNSGQVPPPPPPAKMSWVIILLAVLATICFFTIIVVGILAAIIMPNFQRARAQGMLAACESNLKNLATACEMYAADNKGYYADSLDDLLKSSQFGSYMRTIPRCPCCREPYKYSAVNKDMHHTFTIQCGEMDAHRATGIVGNGHFPKYTPEKGIERR